MKLKLFNPETFPKEDRRSTRPSISFNKSGTISLNKPAIVLLGIKDGDAIVIANNEDSPEDYFISKSKDGFVLREDKGKTCVIFNHRNLSVEVMTNLGMDPYKTNRLFLSTEPVMVDKNKFYCLLWKK